VGSRLLSRRDFTRCATIGAAVTVSLPSSGTEFVRGTAGSHGELKQSPADAAKLSPQSLIEAEGRYQSILQQYGQRFSDVQKADIRRLCAVAQQSLDAVRTYPVGNAEQTGLYLKPLVERDKKSTAPPPTAANIMSGKHHSTADIPASGKP